ncbi:MAG TPA: hypothetical protein VFX28_02010, partial [Methylomirabilota bacterium]|nr:hypothetical protein [Methylomirabilota bacterium]
RPVSRLYFLTDGKEMLRRRGLVPRDAVVEAWPDLVVGGGTYWVGEESKRLLDAAGEPMRAELSVPADAVGVFYGPRLRDLESLPREESLRARVASAHGVAVAWVTLDAAGQRVAHEPASPADPTFHLRRAGGGAGHLWRLFETRAEAIAFVREQYGDDAEAAAWAEALPAADFAALLRSAEHGR